MSFLRRHPALVLGLVFGAFLLAAPAVAERGTLNDLWNMAFFVVLASALFATFSLVIACLVKTRERFMGIGQVLTMPLFFASNAIYPLAMMPSWLRVISRCNPLTYVVDALRAFMVGGGTLPLAVDFGVVVGVLVALVAIAAWRYPTLVH